ncbi:transcription factor VIP1-like [Cornus florida]|uniref:transcription factor VIP1-like n=1 Tax=Cornus florida TaxID=4283 RepID=UPI0028A1FEDD|nr:transcription factor VIP1-like [Cornus florida]
MDPEFAGKPITAPSSAIDQMPETPNRRAHHRRARSDTFFRFPDDILLDDDVDIADFNLDISSLLSSDTANLPITTVHSDSSNGRDNSKPKPVAPISSHFRSLSVDADFFDGLDFSSAADGGESDRFGVNPAAEKGVGGRHRHSNSMDGCTSSFEGEWMLDAAKKAMAPDKLAELSLIDPKRAKRVLANRQSAARSKERKVRYMSELEKKVQTLQTEATTLSAQVTMLQRGTTGLTAENKELKLRLEALEKEAHLRDALNDALREEVQRLKIATINGNPFSRDLASQFSSHLQALHRFSTNQTQQPQQQQQLHISHSTANNQTPSELPQPSLLDFNQRV